MIRILLIDDHTLFRSGVKALLQRQPDFADFVVSLDVSHRI